MEIEELEESGESRRVIGSVELGKKKKKSIFLTPDDEPAEAELSASPIVKKEKKKEEKEKPAPLQEELPKVVSIGSGAGAVGYTLPALTMLDEIQAEITFGTESERRIDQGQETDRGSGQFRHQCAAGRHAYRTGGHQV